MVPMEGFEPTRPFGHQILSLARLPVPPHRHTHLFSPNWPKSKYCKPARKPDYLYLDRFRNGG